MNAPIKTPTSRAITSRSVGLPVHIWHRELGFVSYYTLDTVAEQIAPFGMIGPFPNPSEMRAAMDRIDARFPGATIVSRKCGLDEEFITDIELDIEYSKALEKLDALGA